VQINKLSIAGLLHLVPARFGDERGFFSETFNAGKFHEATGADSVFVQDNHSLSRDVGVLRGLHCQLPPFAQSKLLRVTRGRIFDVAVDIRRSSPTYGHWEGLELSAKDWNQLYIPKGFLHGFCTLEPDTEVIYKVDTLYAPGHEAGVIWKDPDLAIKWPLLGKKPTLSAKDQVLPRFADFQSPFE